MKNMLKAAVTFLTGAGIFSAIVLGVRALNEGAGADLIGPAIAVAAFILPASFLAIPLVEVGTLSSPIALSPYEGKQKSGVK